MLNNVISTQTYSSVFGRGQQRHSSFLLQIFESNWTTVQYCEFIDSNFTTTKLSLMGQRKSVVKKLGDTKMVIVLNRGYCSQGTFGRRQGWTTIWGEGWPGMGDKAPLSVLTHVFLFHSSPEFLAEAEIKTYNWVYTRQYLPHSRHS